jgi:hypothetical protein
MIARDAQPIGHVPPYKRIDIRHPGRKAVITRAEVEQGVCREPDAEAYYYDHPRDCWVLRGG